MNVGVNLSDQTKNENQELLPLGAVKTWYNILQTFLFLGANILNFFMCLTILPATTVLVQVIPIQ